VSSSTQWSFASLGKRSSVAVTVSQISSAVRPSSAADWRTLVTGGVARGLRRSVVILTISLIAIVVVLALPASIVVVRLDADSIKLTAQVDLDLATVGLTHLNLPCGTPFVLSLRTDGAAAAGRLHCSTLRPVGLRAGRLLVVTAYGLGDACAANAESESRRPSDQKLPASGHL
jgi:hypothetical protein